MKRATKRIISVAATLVALCIIIVIVQQNVVSAVAGATLPGVESIVLANGQSNPYTIVEVVPNKADARLGYLVGGEEPIKEGKSLRDMPSEAERTEAMAAFGGDISSNELCNQLVTSGALSYQSGYIEDASGNNELSIRGYLVATSNGNYSTASVPAVYRAYDETTDIGKTRYGIFVDIQGGDQYAITLRYITNNSDKRILYNGTEHGIYNIYNIIESTPLESLGTDFSSKDGEFLYQKIADLSGNDMYEYSGSVTLSGNDPYYEDVNGTVKQIAEITNPADYYFIDLELNRAAGDYCLGSYTPVPAGRFSIVEHYETSTEGDFVLDRAEEVSLVYDPTNNSDLAFVTDYSYNEMEHVSYSNGIQNAEWLKHHTFDIDLVGVHDFILDVKTVTMEEFNALDLSTVDMVFLSGGTYGTDLQDSQAIDVFSRVVKEKMPVIMEKGFDNAGMPNIHKLATLLCQINQESVNLQLLPVNWTMNDYWTSSTTGLENKRFAPPTVSGCTQSYVNRSVFIFDDTTKDFVNGDFLTSFSTEQIAYGFDLVKSEIDNENFYRSRSNMSTISTTISQATAMRYIINFASQRIVIKSEINVLEIEPCYSFQEYYTIGTSDLRHAPDNDLRRVYVPGKGTQYVDALTKETIDRDSIANNWANQFKTDPSKIHLKQTYTREFIGLVEDLNENYDLIYVGLDTTTMNTSIVDGVKSNDTVYNDTTLNGLVYLHTGDLVDMTDDWGRTDNEVDRTRLFWPGKNETYQYRMSGNDITKEKLLQLEEFIRAGYPVIFADAFFTYDSQGAIEGVNSSKIDTSSNMYALGVFALDYKDRNVFNSLAVTNSNDMKERLSTYLNLSKLTVSPTVLPVAYTNNESGTAGTYLTQIDGNYVLDYEFALKNDAAVSIADTKYNVQLFIDTSVDGRFSSLEEIPSLLVYELNNSAWYPIAKNASGNYELIAGKNYRVKRNVPTGYVGVLPWKLLFTQNDNPLVRKSLSGYTAVPIETADREVINVLQITSGSGSTSLDLTTSDVKKQLDLVPDFDILITKISARKFVTDQSARNENDISNYMNFLKDYDMLILGFKDMYAFDVNNDRIRSAAAANAIKKFINDGRSVLFTHDTTSYNNNPSSSTWGYAFNTYIRGAVGMDRYNVFNEQTAYDVAYQARSNKTSILSQNDGYSDSVIMRWAKGQIYNTTSRPSMYVSGSSLRGLIYDNKSNLVTKVNDGQITTYPFIIPDKFQIATTHSQYYQLNLDTDSHDANTNDDIVVWYCMSDITNSSTDDAYQATPNNVRNNYYIYNKGNVTYSGVGHSSVNTNAAYDVTELRLFINTMVAAYKSGVHPPKVTYKDSEHVYAPTIESTYMPYDAALDNGSGMYLDDSVSFYFEISDTSFIQGTRTIYMKYYMEVPSGTPGSVEQVVDGTNTSLLEIVPNYIMKGDTTISDIHTLQPDVRYKMNISTASLDNHNKDVVRLYVAAQTVYTQPNGVTVDTGVGYYSMKVVRTEIFDLE